jgi:hypothetical protein
MSGEKYPEKHTGLLLVLITAMLTVVPLAYAETPVVPPSGGYVTALIDSGLVRGKLSDDGAVEVYQGIPYAAPPVANLRWAPPQPPAHWSGPRDALKPLHPARVATGGAPVPKGNHAKCTLSGPILPHPNCVGSRRRENCLGAWLQRCGLPAQAAGGGHPRKANRYRSSGATGDGRRGLSIAHPPCDRLWSVQQGACHGGLD